VRLLWLTPEAPDPGGAGGAIRSFHQIAGLARRGVGLSVVAPAHADQARRAASLAELGVDLELVPRPRGQLEEGLRGLAARPSLAVAAAALPWLGLQAAVFWTRVGPAARRLLATDGYDAVIVEHDFAAAWGRELPTALPAGLVFHNTFWRYYERLDGLGRRIEGQRFRAHVARQLPRYARGFAVSELERAEIRELAPEMPVDVVPNGVDARRLAHIEPGSGDDAAIVFVGTLAYPPNAEAVLWFCREVLPKVRMARPGVTLTVVGRGAPAELRRFEGVITTDWVEDVAPYLASAPVAIAPLRSGGGTNLKVIEALAAGRGLVATSFGAKGLDVVAGEHLLVADRPQQFAEAVIALLGDRALCSRLGTAGRELAQARYDWAVLARSMHASLERWLA
jgi:glycosyltransferase involved in cell wall biosynthesis